MADPKLGSTNYNVVQLDGQAFTINSIAVTVLFRDQNGNVLWCTGSTVPTNASSGYAIGCLFAGSALWYNTGTASSSTFKPVGNVTA